MGDHVVETQAREILGHLPREVQLVLESLIADRDQLQARVRELTDQLEKERSARHEEQELVEAYRRDYQKLYVKANPPTQEDIEFWRNAKREDFNVSWDEVEVMLKEFEDQR